MANTFLFLVILSVGIAYVMLPYKTTFQFLFTGKHSIKPDCDFRTPKLNLEPVKECSVAGPNEPCIIRNGVSTEMVDKFLSDNGEQRFIVKDLPTSDNIGNPLMEPVRFSSITTTSCSFSELIGGKEGCTNVYSGFKSLNFSHYLPLNNSDLRLEDYTRTDIFLGSPSKDTVTASFHSNNFEKSSTLQLYGEKIWLMMKPEDYYETIGAYTVGAYNAAWSVCVSDLEKITLKAVHTYPGDILNFPKAYPHHIYSLAGPNIMINFRSFHWHAWKLRDLLSLVISQLTKGDGGLVDTKNCGADTSPSSYGNGNPGDIHMSTKLHLEHDMRCTDIFNKNIHNYKIYAQENSQQSAEVDRDIFDQVGAFLKEA
jgi:hypothetical protein